MYISVYIFISSVSSLMDPNSERDKIKNQELIDEIKKKKGEGRRPLPKIPSKSSDDEPKPELESKTKSKSLPKTPPPGKSKRPPSNPQFGALRGKGLSGPELTMRPSSVSPRKPCPDIPPIPSQTKLNFNKDNDNDKEKEKKEDNQFRESPLKDELKQEIKTELKKELSSEIRADILKDKQSKDEDIFLKIDEKPTLTKYPSDSVAIKKQREDNNIIEKSRSNEPIKKGSYFGRLARRVSQEFGGEFSAIEVAALQKNKNPFDEYCIDSDAFHGCSESNGFPTDTSHIDTSVYDIAKGITIKKFNDYRPINKQYFFRPPGVKDTTEKDGIAVVIPFFNEPSYELQQTLNSLHTSFLEVRKASKKWRDKKLYVCLIQDGWNKADNSMKEYLKDMFPKQIKNDDNEYVGWWDYFEEFKDNSKNPNATFIIERKNYLPTPVNTQTLLNEDKKLMRITLVIKANNRRKHNSHEWFLAKSGFAEATNAKYLFLTDAFTLYSKTCIYYLIKDLDKNPDLTAVTGRQRLMTRKQQGSGESVFSFSYALRNIQLFDFELANAVYNGAFSLGGLLPVIPGPCGMYRAEDLLQDQVRDSYFNVVNEEPHKTGLILGNLRIAEDRILSYYSVIKPKDRRRMAFNPLAVFYFEAETDLQKFILQRRRWINGSVAGYIYLLFLNFTDFKNWDANIFRKIYIWFLLMCQFFIYCEISLVPGIAIKILYSGINYFFNYYDVKFTSLQLMATFIVLWVIYIAHVVVHYKERFVYLIWYLLTFISVFTSLTSYASILHYFLMIDTDELMKVVKSGNIVMVVAFFVIIAPFFLALCLSGKGHSFLYMIKSFIHYMLFLPLLVGWFPSYAYARTWDLTWGNRPANELNDITEEQKNIMITKFKEKSIRIIVVIIILNIATFFLPLQGIYGLMSIFFAIVLIQMFFSFIFCMKKIYYKCKMGTKKVKNKKSYVELDSEV